MQKVGELSENVPTKSRKRDEEQELKQCLEFINDFIKLAIEHKSSMEVRRNKEVEHQHSA